MSVPLRVLAVATLLGACTSSPTGPRPPGDPAVLLTVLPSVAVIHTGHAMRLTANVKGAAGQRVAPEDITWSSTNDHVAQVGTDGLVQGLVAGEVQIVARWRDARGSARVTVVADTPRKKCPELRTDGPSEIPTGIPCLD